MSTESFQTCPRIILLAIFNALMDQLEENPATSTRTNQRMIRQTIIAASHVCHTWRRVALRLNHVWVRLIDFQHSPIEQIRHLLDLSSPLPFDFGRRDAPIRLPGQPGLSSLLLRYENRIREWNVRFDRTDLSERWYRLFAFPLHSLEALRWEGPFAPVPHQTEMEKFRFWLPMNRITSLSIDSSNLPFPNIPLHSLTSLHVANTSTQPHAPTIAEWLDILRGSPSLEMLSIQDAIKPSTSDMDTFVPLELPNLRLLSLGDNRSGNGAVFALLTCIFATPKCALVCTAPTTFEQPYNTVFKDALLSWFHDAIDNRELGHFPLHFCVSKDSDLTMSNVADPAHVLDWNGVQGIERVTRFLDSVAYKVLSIRVPRVMGPSTFECQKILRDIKLGERFTSVDITVHPDAIIPTVKTPEDIVHVVPLRLEGLDNVRELTFHGRSSLLPTAQCVREWAFNRLGMRIPVLPVLERIIFRDFIDAHVISGEVASLLAWRRDTGYRVNSIRFEDSSE
ncbi:hypothetical protein CC1G_09882 [Coprinopsis cinerea okayama7|uniref:F-box domain-containing protein n=1 Tax=Coprinopsis cinerea (strain Okayama-7 / 130 / ATCC MYA-4618 / FGSC 9003) TaxID=240176 RepID=A8N8M3_COPC7|nr:hypothetical protein CC1G_09882 [Coprinopsis cinerea okayama7\|eukprot:XP_001831179.1 hypothetical protein CC1G_09882 [Coprinopsis cinerea okayama7\